MSAQPLLAVEELSAGYGSARALDSVSFELAAGACIGIVGPNGAGKTTLARAVSGSLRPWRGRVLLLGDDLAGMATHRIARRGVIRLPETRGIFRSLTVEQNLQLSLGRLRDRQAERDAMSRVLDEFEILRDRRRQRAGTLSGGEQQILALSHVVVAPPPLLVVDELSLGLAPIVIERMYGLLRQVKAAGTSIVLIEQFLDRALGFADHVVALARGSAVWEGPSAELTHDRYFQEVTGGPVSRNGNGALDAHRKGERESDER